ncbi:hypothetical protein MKX03_006984 [Papaver bracteatum]|nr:hypothetical protein MKX03_006984 [Papaver bracteatum]
MLLLCVVSVFQIIWWKPKSLEKLLKQQDFSWRQKRLIVFLNAFWFGTTPRVLICDPDMMREILSNKFGHLRKPPLNLLTKGLTVLENDKWAKHRRVMTPAFHHEKLKEMMPAFTSCCAKLIERWIDLVGLSGESYEVDVWPELQNFAGDVLSRAAFGSSIEEGKKIFELQKEQVKLVVEASQSFYVPGFRFLPTKKNRRRMKLDSRIRAMFRELINKKEQAIRNKKSRFYDLLGLLLQCNVCMTMEEVTEECKLFYFTGQDTTSTWLTWTMIKAREEVIRICGKNTPQFESLALLKTVTMILYEVQKLYPPVIQQHRYTYKKVQIRDLTLPAGMALAMILQNFSFDQSQAYTHAPHTMMTLQPQHGAPVMLHRLH